MKLRGFSPIVAAGLALAIGAAGCGSSSSSSTTASSTPHTTSTRAATGTSASSTKAKAEAKLKGKAKELKTTYKPGEFCTSKNEKLYKAQSLACVNGHLKSTSDIKSSTTKTTT